MSDFPQFLSLIANKRYQGNQPGLTIISLVYCFPIGPGNAYWCWGFDLDFQCHKARIQFPEHNSKRFGAINLILDSDTCWRSGKMPNHFGVAILNFWITECKKVKNHFWWHNFITIIAIKLNLGTQTLFESSKTILECAMAVIFDIHFSRHFWDDGHSMPCLLVLLLY